VRVQALPPNSWLRNQKTKASADNAAKSTVMDLTPLETPLFLPDGEGEAEAPPLEPLAGAVAVGEGDAVANAPIPDKPPWACPTVDAAEADAWKVEKGLAATSFITPTISRLQCGVLLGPLSCLQ